MDLSEEEKKSLEGLKQALGRKRFHPLLIAVSQRFMAMKIL